MRHIHKGLFLLVALIGLAAWGAGALAAPPPGPARPAFGPDIRVSTDNPGQPHHDPVAAADPLNPLHFIVGATDTTGAGGSRSGVYFTTDDGQTWGGGNLLGPYPPGPAITPSGEVRAGIDRFNHTYVADQGTSATGYCPGGMYSHRSTDGGATFQTPVPIVTNSQIEIAEGLALAVNQDPSGTWAGRVYAAYGAIAATNCVPSSTGPSLIRFSYSSDNGVNWTAPVTFTQPVDPLFQRVLSQFPAVAAGSSGRVYVGYIALTSLLDPTHNARIYVNRSLDGGSSFGTFHATTAAALTLPGYVDFTTSFGDFVQADTAGHGLLISPAPVLVVSPTDSLVVYAAWTHHQSGWDTTYQAACCGGSTTQQTFQASDIAFVRSTDGGTTWGALVRVNDDALNNAKDQFTPALSVSTDGVLHLSWYDRRDDPNNLLYHRYYSRSTDGGTTWSVNERVSDVPSDPAAVLGSDSNATIGLYSGLAANTSRVLPFWVDTRSGTPAGEQRIYTDPDVIGGNPTPTATVPPGATATVTSGPGSTATPTATGGPASTATATATATVCSVTFNDVPVGSTFYAFIRCLACRGIVGGYPCGGPAEPCPGSYYRPNNNVTRGQVSKIVSESAQFSDPVPSAQQSFEDVAPSSTFWVWIERLSTRGIISGYPCGGAFEPCVAPNNRPYFRPNNNVTRGQLSKITSGAAGWTETPTGQTFEDAPPASTFYLYIERMAVRGVISGYPCGGPFEPCVGPANRPYFRPNNNATRGQMSKIAASAFFPNCQTPARR
jgi:hypothetical protein